MRKVLFVKGGQGGGTTPRVSIPMGYIKALGITKEQPEVRVTLQGNKIIIKKAEEKEMLGIVELKRKGSSVSNYEASDDTVIEAMNEYLANRSVDIIQLYQGDQDRKATLLKIESLEARLKGLTTEQLEELKGCEIYYNEMWERIYLTTEIDGLTVEITLTTEEEDEDYNTLTWSAHRAKVSK